MSRIGKMPIDIPPNVEASLSGYNINIKGPKGSLTFKKGSGVDVKIIDKKIVVSILNNEKQSKANFGTTRAILNTYVKGVTTGWKKSLELVGVGFNAKLSGKEITIACGFSHDVKVIIPEGLSCIINKNSIDIEGSNRESVCTFAAKIRKIQPPEPYLGKGIKYSNEVVRRKAGKTGKK